jgi:adhesin/invasin
VFFGGISMSSVNDIFINSCYIVNKLFGFLSKIKCMLIFIYINLFKRMPKLFFALIAALFLTSTANAITFDCDNTLYAVRANDNLYKVTVTDAGSISGSWSTSLGNLGSNRDTIALGPWSGNGTGTLTLFAWKWDNTNPRIGYTLNGGTLNGAGNNFTVYSSNAWSGGEVNQITGELFFGGREGRRLDNNFYIMRYNSWPYYQIESGKILKSTAAGRDIKGYVASDMALDAKGNAYIIAHEDANDSPLWLVRVVPGAAGQWKYNAVKQITGTVRPTGTDIWGMSFINGKLFVASNGGSGGGGGGIYRIDPITGESVKAIGEPGGSIYDLATCQTAPVIEGIIYHDVNGNGVIDSSENTETLPGITVQIYNSAGTYLGEQMTDAAGSYSFIVNSINNADFYIRVKNPYIGERTAAQTYASAGSFTNKNWPSAGSNDVTAYCADFDNKIDRVAKTTNGTCYGARLNGVDNKTDNSINTANYYSKVTMSSDKSVASADFAFTIISDKSDAPTSYGEVWHKLGYKDASGKPIVYLGSNVSVDTGSKVSANADGDDYDDGMFARINNVWTPLQNAVFLRGKEYTFRAYIDGVMKEEACIKRFIGLDAAGNAANVFRQIETETGALCFRPTGAGVTDRLYTIPTTSGALTTATFFRARLIHLANDASYNITPDSTVATHANTPWAINGEVEDYKIFVVGRQIRLGVKSIGDVGSFTFGISNVETTAPSIATRTLQTTASDVLVPQPYDGTVHAINVIGSDIAITPTSVPTKFGLVKSQTSCVDLSHEASGNLSITFDNSGKITVPGAEVQSDSDIVCNITYGVEPTLELVTTKVSNASAYDNFNITIKDATDTILRSNQTTSSAQSVSTGSFQVQADSTYTFDQTMASGSTSGLNHYSRDINCTNLKDDSAIAVSTLPFDIDVTFGDNIKCVITNDAIHVNILTSDITVVPSTQTVGGNATITVTIKDGSGNIIDSGGDNVVIFMNATTVMKLTNGVTSYSSMIANVAAVDNGNGTYDAYISSDISGTAVLTFSVHGVLSAKNASVEFIPDDYDENKSSITAVPNSTVVGNISVVTVRVSDNGDNGINGLPVSIFVITPNSANATVTSVFDTGAGGIYTANLTSVIEDNYTVGFSVSGVTNTLHNATVEFYHDAPCLDNTGQCANSTTSITANPTLLEVNTNSTVKVHLSDKNGNTITNETIEIFIVSGNGSISSTTLASDERYTAELTSSKVETVIVGFRIISIGDSALTANASFTSSASSGENSRIDVTHPDDPTTSIRVDNPYPYTITATVKDNSSTPNPVANSLVTFTVEGGVLNNSTANGTTVSCITNLSGVCSVTWSSTQAGTFNVTANVDGKAISNSPQTRTFIAGSASLINSIFSVENGTKQISTSTGFWVNSTIKDAYNNSINATVVYFSVTPSSTVYSATCQTDGNGYCGFTWTSEVAGFFDIIAFLDNNQTKQISQSPQTREFTAGPPSSTISYLVVNPNANLTADNSSAFTATAYVRDYNNNSVGNGTTVNFVVGGGILDGTATTGSCITDNSGSCFVSWKSADAGTFQINATINANQQITDSGVYRTFKSSDVSAEHSQLQIVEVGPKVADGVEYYTAIVTARDIYDNPVSDTTISFDASGGNYAPSCNTDTNGQCNITWTNTVSGNFNLSAIAEGQNITNSPQTREFTAGLATGNRSLLTIDKVGPITADNSSTYIVTVYAKDKNNNNVSNTAVTFNVGNGNAYLSPVNCTTDNSGECFVSWKSDTVGDFTINATINGELVNASVSDKQRGFVFGEPNSTTSYVVITPDPTVTQLTADSYTPFTITAYIKDLLGHSVNGTTVSFTTSLGDLTSTNCISDVASGSCSVNLTSSVSGTALIHVTINGADITNSPANANFTSGSATPGNSTLEVIGTEPQLVGTGYYTVRVNAKDITGNNVAGASITLGVIGGSLTQTLCNTDASGQCNVTWSSLTSGNHTVYALIAGQNITNSPQNRLFIADVAKGDNSILTVNPGSDVKADNSSTYTVTVHARDIYNNSVPNTAVSFNAGNGNAFLSPVNCTTDNSGECFVSWKSDTVGNFTINGTINAELVNATDAHKWRLFINSNISSSLSELNISPAGPITADWVDEYQINVVVRDDNNVAAPFAEVEFYLPGNMATNIGFNNVLSNIAAGCTTNASGSCSANITLKSQIAGTYTIAARIKTSLISIGNANRTFVAGAIHGGNTALTITPNSGVVADGIDNYNLSIRVADFYDNPVNATQINFTVGGGSLSNAYCTTNVYGICNVDWTSLVAGTYQVNASVAANGSIAVLGSEVTKTFIADSVNVTRSNITAAPTVTTTEGNSTITVTLNDTLGNLVENSTAYLIVITTDLSNSSFDGGVGSSITLSNVHGGVYTAILRSTSAGTAHVTFSVDGAVSPNSANVLFEHGEPCLDNTGQCANSTTSITANPNPQTAGQNSTITVHLSDKYGNDVTNATNVVVLIKEDNTTNDNASLYFNGNTSHIGGGNYTVNLISYTSGNVAVGFKMNSDESALSEVVVFNSGNYSLNGTYTSITATPNQTVAGNSSLITVFLADDNGNGVSGQDVEVIIINGHIGSLGSLTSTTDVGGGVYTAILNSIIANNVTVGFTIDPNQSNKTAIVEFEAGIGNASLSNISVNPSTLSVGNTSTITVVLLDDYGNVITTGGESVSIVISNPTNGLELSDGMTANNISVIAIDNGDGTYTAYLTSSVSVAANVTFTVNGVYPDPIIAQLSNTVADSIVTFEDYAIDLYVTLNASTKQARIGDLVRYTAVIENRGGTKAIDYTLANIIPKGFSYVDGSVLAGGNKSDAVTWNASLKINELTLDSGQTMTIMYILRVGAGVRQGTYETQAVSYRTPDLIAADKISNIASASVEVLINDPLFDESLIFGTVYHDKNSNGIQDEGEEGIPGAKIVTVEGYVIITDQFGRYHLLNILGGEWGVGRNFIMKVDPSSIPKSSKFTTTNPLLRRITPGIPVRFDFGVVFADEKKDTKEIGSNATDVQTTQRRQK